MTNPTKILVSTCLMGFPVRYNGSAKPFMPPTLLRWQQEDRLILCCPEVSAGFPTPRLSAEIRYSPLGERAVVESDNTDVTAGYLAAVLPYSPMAALLAVARLFMMVASAVKKSQAWD